MATVVYRNGPAIRDTIKKIIAKKTFNSKLVNFAESAGVPAGTADGLVLCWDSTDGEDIYIGSVTTWTKIID